MAIDQHYIPAFSIEDVLLDKDTGAPLSGGQVFFEQDNQRGTLKPVYQITGASPNYTFIELPNPVILSSIGTFEDAMGNPVIPYFYPYDGDLNPEYYFVRVLSSDDVPQFTRESVPYISADSGETSLSAFTNEISNPQFAIVNFDISSPPYEYNFNTVTDEVVEFAPRWDLVVTSPGVGTVSVTQDTPAGSSNIITNPATILLIASAGLSKLHVRTRIYGTPNLWGNGFLSVSFVAKTFSGTSALLNMYYSQSDGTVVDQLLVSATLPSSGNYQQFTGTAAIPISNNPDTFPNAYIDLYFDLPLGIEIGLTSIMVAYSKNTSIPDLQYDEESVARQVDHLYHYAYPIVPIGTIIDFAGFSAPSHYFECNGAAINRITYYQLFSTITTTETVTLTNAVNTFTVVDGTKYYIGMPLEGTGITPGTTISNISTNTITMSAVATVSSAESVRFFIAGVGDGSTTFNLPDLRGYVVAGSGTPTGFTLFTSVGVGETGGSSTHTLSTAELPPHTHTYGLWTNTGGGGFGAAAGTLVTTPSTATGNGPGTSTPFSIIQPSVLMRKCIRYQ